MTAPTDRQRRPLYVDRVRERFFADPLIGNGVWPEVKLVPGMFGDAPANTLFGRAGTPGPPDYQSADTVINVINTASAAQILAARVVYASTTGAGVVQLTDSVSSASTTTAATPNSVKTVYDAALLKAGGTMSGALVIGATSSLIFEGSTDDAFETTLSVENPTADRTIRLPDRSGDVVTTGDTGTVTSAMILDEAIVDADVNSNAAIAHSKLATLSSGNVLLGNASNVATGTAVSGDVTISNTGVTSISSNVIVDADINSSAAISHSKLASMTAAQVLLGNASNVPTSTAVSGDVTISSTGVTAISAGVIVDGNVSASAGIGHSKLASMTAGTLLLGNGSNVPTATAMSGDATINSSGVVSVNTTALDLFTSSTAGIVGASGGGTSNYLRADGSWAPPYTGGQTGSAPLFAIRTWGIITNGKDNGQAFVGGNVTSTDRFDVGKYKVNFTVAMPSSTYCVLATAGTDNDHVITVKNRNTTYFELWTTDAGTGNNDFQNTDDIHFVVIF